jgi:hypothetical protein
MNNFFTSHIPMESAAMTSRMGNKKHRTVKTSTRNAHEQLLLKRSDKMKLVYWNGDSSLVYLKHVVISADFVIDQDAFWEKEKER